MVAAAALSSGTNKHKYNGGRVQSGVSNSAVQIC